MNLDRYEIADFAGLRLSTAINKASITNRLATVLLIDQPTIIRKYRSIIAAKYSQPSLFFIKGLAVWSQSVMVRI